MSSRAAPSVRRDPANERDVDRDWSDGITPDGWGRRVVCKRCSLVMTDVELYGTGEFNHIAKPHQTRAAKCSNAGRRFGIDSSEVVPFRRKGERRKLKRRGIRP